MANQNTPGSSWLAASGLRLSDWFERWFPDAFVLALIAVTIVYLACVGIGNSPIQTAQWFGAGFWDLVAFTMQMTMIIISGYALATARPIYALICRLAAIPTNGKNAAAFVALFSMLSSLLSWSFSLIFSGLLAREVAHRVRGADYRAIGPAGPTVGGVFIQYPVYAGIVKKMNESGLPKSLAQALVSVSSRHTFPVLCGISSA